LYVRKMLAGWWAGAGPGAGGAAGGNADQQAQKAKALAEQGRGNRQALQPAVRRRVQVVPAEKTIQPAGKIAPVIVLAGMLRNQRCC